MIYNKKANHGRISERSRALYCNHFKICAFSCSPQEIYPKCQQSHAQNADLDVRSDSFVCGENKGTLMTQKIYINIIVVQKFILSTTWVTKTYQKRQNGKTVPPLWFIARYDYLNVFINLLTTLFLPWGISIVSSRCAEMLLCVILVSPII